MSTLGGFSLGSVTALDKDFNSDGGIWTLSGVLISSIETARQDLENLRYLRQPAYLNLASPRGDLSGFVKVGRTSFRPRGPLYYYTIDLEYIPGIGVWLMQTDDAYLHDYPNYVGKLKVLDPSAGRSGFAYTYAASRDQYTSIAYLNNNKAAIQSLTAEITVGDDLATLDLYGWKAGAWAQIAEWGTGATAWGTPVNFTDDAAVVHAVKPNVGVRGASVAGIGTISNMPGCNYRVLMSVDAFAANGASDASTDYASDQLLLKAVLKHTRREAARPYTVITYVDDEVGVGPA